MTPLLEGFVSEEEQEVEDTTYREAGMSWASAWFSSHDAEDLEGYAKILLQRVTDLDSNGIPPSLVRAFSEGAWSIERLVTGGREECPDPVFYEGQ